MGAAGAPTGANGANGANGSPGDDGAPGTPGNAAAPAANGTATGATLYGPNGGNNSPLSLQVSTEGSSVTTGGAVPIDITAVGANGATSGGDSGPAQISLLGGLSTTVYLHNGTGRALVPAPSHPGDYTIQVTQQVSPGVALDGSLQVDVEGSNESDQLTTAEAGAQVAGLARGIAETLKELLESTISDSNAFERRALESFEELANKLGWAATKKAELIPLAIHLVALFNDYNQHNQEQFGKDFSNVIEDSLDAATGIGLKLITATSPVGAVGGLVLGGLVTIGVKTFYSKLLEKGIEDEGQKLYSALSGQGESVLTEGGTDYAPGAGDPPPGVIVSVPAQDSATQIANLTQVREFECGFENF